MIKITVFFIKYSAIFTASIFIICIFSLSLPLKSMAMSTEVKVKIFQLLRHYRLYFEYLISEEEGSADNTQEQQEPNEGIAYNTLYHSAPIPHQNLPSIRFVNTQQTNKNRLTANVDSTYTQCMIKYAHNIDPYGTTTILLDTYTAKFEKNFILIKLLDNHKLPECVKNETYNFLRKAAVQEDSEHANNQDLRIQNLDFSFHF